MKIVYSTLLFCLLGLAASAQLNTDSTRATSQRMSMYDLKVSRTNDHLHPKYANLANPGGPGYDIDGAVFRSEAIINRHATNINDLIR